MLLTTQTMCCWTKVFLTLALSHGGEGVPLNSRVSAVRALRHSCSALQMLWVHRLTNPAVANVTCQSLGTHLCSSHLHRCWVFLVTLLGFLCQGLTAASELLFLEARGRAWPGEDNISGQTPCLGKTLLCSLSYIMTPCVFVLVFLKENCFPVASMNLG